MSGSKAESAAAPTLLFVMPWSSDAIGGVSEVVVNLYRAFAANGPLNPRLLTEAYPHRTVVEIETRSLGTIDGLYLITPSGPAPRQQAAFLLRLPGMLVRVRQYLRHRSVRAINIHYPSLSAILLLLARRAYDRRVPVVLSFHGTDASVARSSGPLDRWLWARVIRHADAIVVCSHALGEEVRAIFPGVGAKLHVIFNGVDAEVCRVAARAISLPTTLHGARYIACIGTFEAKKGQDVLLAAFRKIAALDKDLHLVLVGRSGPTLASLRAAVAREALAARIHFFPDRDHASAMAILSHATLMVHPPRREPFGLVLLEAASLGVPVVATRVGGIPEIVEDRRTGRLVASEDPVGLAAAIMDVLADPAAARGMAAALREDAESRFSWQRAAALYAQLFKVVPAAAQGVEPRNERRSHG